jgi:hypothetical protein
MPIAALLIRKNHWFRFGPLFVVAVLGCDRREPSALRTTDSAGVSIVLSDGPSWTATEGWRIDSVPLADLGDATDSVGIVDLAGIALLPDGGVVAGDHSDNSIHFHDASGRRFAKVGRNGDGPGEFSWLSRIRVAGDSVLVWDRSLQRITTYAATGQFGSTRRIEFAGTYTSPTFETRWDDGRWLFVEGASISSRQPIGSVRAMIAVIRLDSAASRDSVLGRWPGQEQMAVTSSQLVSELSLPYARSTTIRGDSAGFWVGTGDAPRIDRFDRDGKWLRSVRWGASPIPVAAGELKAWRDRGTASFSRTPPSFAAPFVEAFGKAVFPETRPAYRTYLIDDTGALWARRVPRWDAQDSVEVWDVLTPDGGWLGPVAMPPRVSPRAVGANVIVAVFTDDDDVERLRLYRLVRDRR